MRTVSVKLMADVGHYSRNMRGAANDTKNLIGELDRASKAGHLDNVTQAATGLGIGLLGVAGTAVKFSMDFEKQMSSVKAATHASSGEIDALRRASLQAGKDTQFSATEAARGVEELAKAGVQTSDILGGGLKGALDLAAAGQLDVGEAAETAASALTQFKLQGSDVPHVADLLAAAAGKAQGSVHDMGMALNQAGLVASQTGLSIEETTGGLAAFASAGLTGSDAGTSFKQMLLMLQSPSGKTKDMMDELGISLYDASGNVKGLAQFAGELRERLSGLTPEVRANAMAQIFGADAVRGASILYEQGQAGIQGWIDKTNDAGYAAETAAMKTDNLAGDIERLKGSLETQAIEAGGGLNQGLRVLTKSADALVGSIGQLPSGVTASMTVLAALSGALTLGLVGWLKARTAMAAVVAELNAVGPAGARAAVGLQAAQKWAGRAAAAFVGLEVAGAVFDKLGNSAVNVNKLTAALEDYATTGKLTQGLTDEFGQNLDDFALIAQSAEAATHGFWGGLNDLTSSIPGVSSAVDSMNESLYGTSFNDATERMKALDEALAQYMATQKDATKASELWNQLVLKSGLDITQLAELLPNAWNGLGELQKKAHSGAAAQGDLAGKTQQSADAMKKAEEEAKRLNDAFDKLFEGQMSIDRANIKYREGMVAVRQELRSGRRELGLDTDEGRKNRSAVLDQIDTIKDLRDARIAHGWSLDSANKKYVKDIDGLRKTMSQAGFTRKEIEKLTGKYRAVPGKVSTEVKVTGEKAALQKLTALAAYQQALKKGSSNIASIRKQLSKDNADFLKYDKGGWTGPGAKYDEAGIVHADEFVVRKESRQRFERNHPGHLDYLNRYGELPMYAGGGRVVWPFPVNASGTRIPSKAEVSSQVTPSFGNWPSSPSAQRGDSGIWRSIRALIMATGPMSGSFGNGYRPGDPLWHGSGRAVDWMGYNQDRLARYLASLHPLELIHRTRSRDYAYTRGRNKGSFNNALMEAHRNHIHIAMRNGGVIREPVFGYGASGRSYSFGEDGIPETVIPGSPRYLPPAAAPIVVQVTAPPGAAGGARGPLVGAVYVQDRTDADMLINRIQFAMGSL